MELKNMNIGKTGPCMVSGHPKNHKLELNPCWSTMRRYLLDHSWSDFLAKVNEKS